MKRSYYQNTTDKFLVEDTNTIFGHLAKNHQHDLEDQQKNAWLKQIEFLKSSLKNIQGHIYFEFSIPRMGKRVDNILITKNLIFVIEFKIGAGNYTKDAQYQAIDYCLDLLNFHAGSHNKTIIPILVATKASDEENDIQKAIHLENCILCNENNFEIVINDILSTPIATKNIDIADWENSTYKPVPTIIEAAQALYKGHNVQEISRSDAGTINLSRTSMTINRIIDETKSKDKNRFVF